MRAHLSAIRDMLAGLGYTTDLFAADKLLAQFLILEAPGVGGDFDAELGGGSWAADIRAKAVAGTPEGAAIMLDRVRAILAPGAPDFEGASHPIVAGRSVSVAFVRSEWVGIDPTETNPTTNRHPGIGVDTYRLVSEPI